MDDGKLKTIIDLMRAGGTYTWDGSLDEGFVQKDDTLIVVSEAEFVEMIDRGIIDYAEWPYHEPCTVVMKLVTLRS